MGRGKGICCQKEMTTTKKGSENKIRKSISKRNPTLLVSPRETNLQKFYHINFLKCRAPWITGQGEINAQCKRSMKCFNHASHFKIYDLLSTYEWHYVKRPKFSHTGKFFCNQVIGLNSSTNTKTKISENNSSLKYPADYERSCYTLDYRSENSVCWT